MSSTEDIADNHTGDNIEPHPSKKAKLSVDTLDSQTIDACDKKSLPIESNDSINTTDVATVLRIHSNEDKQDILGVACGAADGMDDHKIIFDKISIKSAEPEPLLIDSIYKQKPDIQPKVVRLATLFLSAPPASPSIKTNDSSTLTSVVTVRPPHSSPQLSSPGFNASVAPSNPPVKLPEAGGHDSLPNDQIRKQIAEIQPKVRLANFYLSAPSSSPPVRAGVSVTPSHQPTKIPEAAEPQQQPELISVNKLSDAAAPNTSALDSSIVSGTANDDPSLHVVQRSTNSPVKSQVSGSREIVDNEKRRQALRGIVMGIKPSPSKPAVQRLDLNVSQFEETLTETLAQTKDSVAIVGITASSQIALSTAELEHEPFISASPIEDISISKSDERKSQNDVVPKKRAPRKDPKPRLPLENRVYYSKKENEVATSFLEDKEDLLDCLPLDDCFILAETFWIFTVKQLDLALNGCSDDGTPNYVDEMISTFSRVRTPNSESDSTPNHSMAPPGVGDNDGAVPHPALKLDSDNPQAQKVPLNEESESSKCQAIKERISFWKKSVSTFRSNQIGKSAVQKRFRLDGPIKLLLPQATQNFFKSIKVETLFSFLALRKSETGAVCDLMSIWRRDCHMSTIPDIGLARHFLGVATRIEAVLSAYPPIPEADRVWMLDPISGLTGAARDFLIRYQKITSASFFLTLRTKDVSIILETWREDNGMEALRGSGKVAMVSAWKAYIKEALEAESDAGKVIDLTSYVRKVQNEKYSVSAATSKEAGGKLKEASTDLALYSKFMLERVLGEGATLLLRSSGIQTAAELFAADTDPSTSHLYKVLMATGIVDGIAAFSKAVGNWRQTMRQHLDRLPKNGTSPSKSDFQEPVSDRKPTTITDVKPNNGTSRTRQTKAEVPFHLSAGNDEEAFNALSTTTKQFLSNVGIRSAYDFLSARSSDLATSFVAWRRSKGKPELKGLGSIASISGWKALVRKKAKDMGL
jgi:hypothetical protein